MSDCISLSVLRLLLRLTPFFALAVSMGISNSARAAESEANCIETAKVCVEAGGTRLVDGIPVSRDCWSWRQTYACVQPDDSTDGCETLNADADNSGPGKCVLKSATCAETVTGTDGTEVCLRSKEEWSCAEKIELPSVNAEWTGSQTETVETVDESACADLSGREDCSKGELVCTESGCTRTYWCGAKNASGCSVLEAAGCSVTEPVCDAGVDPGCAVKVGTAVCEGTLPDGVVEAGDANVEDSTTVNVGKPAKDETACTNLTTSDMKCTKVSETCVDKDPAIRVINGVAYRANCWGYERVMQCERTEPANACTGLEATPGCVEISRTCEKTDETGCAVERVVYLCGSVEEVTPGDAELVESSDAITGLVEVNTCSELDDNEICRKTAEVCLEPGGTKVVNGVEVTKDCWKTEYTYTCGTGSGSESETDDGCETLAARDDCKLTDSVCMGTNEAGECTMTTKTFVCGGGNQEIEAGTVCDGQLCIAGVCDAAMPETSDDFLQAAAVLEIIREAGLYGDVAKDSIFSGTASGCSVKAAGFSCCRSDVSGTNGSLSNSAFSIAVTAGVEAGWEVIKTVGSPYVYDILNSFESTQGILTALYGTAGSGVYSPSLSYYGVTVSMTEGGSFALEFSPMAFLAAVALEMAADYFSCTQDDVMHALRKSRGLCHYVGSWCENNSGFGCLEKKESWVCFNSKIAKTVQEQGRKQLGLGWGTPKNPATRGFTLEEFQALDFTKMDLTGIVAEIAQEAMETANNAVNSKATTQRARERVSDAVAAGDQYVTVNTITGKCFVGEAGIASAQCSAGLAVRSLAPGASVEGPGVMSAATAVLLRGYGEPVKDVLGKETGSLVTEAGK